MGPGELALVLLLVVAVSSATWASRDARRRTDDGAVAFVAGALVLVTFPVGPLLYARLRHRLRRRVRG